MKETHLWDSTVITEYEYKGPSSCNYWKKEVLIVWKCPYCFFSQKFDKIRLFWTLTSFECQTSNIPAIASKPRGDSSSSEVTSRPVKPKLYKHLFFFPTLTPTERHDGRSWSLVSACILRKIPFHGFVTEWKSSWGDRIKCKSSFLLSILTWRFHLHLFLWVSFIVIIPWFCLDLFLYFWISAPGFFRQGRGNEIGLLFTILTGVPFVVSETNGRWTCSLHITWCDTDNITLNFPMTPYRHHRFQQKQWWGWQRQGQCDSNRPLRSVSAASKCCVSNLDAVQPTEATPRVACIMRQKRQSSLKLLPVHQHNASASLF